MSDSSKQIKTESVEEMKERYNNLDGLRAICCLCLIAMHINANANYEISKWLHTIMISWTHFVLLFIMISGFGMSCGYYERIKKNEINLNSFYNKRYAKLIPFFATLIILDIIESHSWSHLIEGITEATLIFGLLPNNSPQVIGVSWTLGVIFLSYMLFPFIVYLCWTKKKAWITFGISIVISVFCSVYFFTDKFVVNGFTPRHNILYCSPYILGGVVVYLYRNDIKSFISRHRWMYLVICATASIAWLFIPGNIRDGDVSNLPFLAISLLWLVYAISVESKTLDNKIVRFISGISMEMYLGHMLVYRIIEKLNLLYVFGHGWLSLLMSWILVVSGLIAFISVWKAAYRKLMKLISPMKKVSF